MTDTSGHPTAAASELQGQLVGEGFAVLAVIADPVDARWFTVYVQGPVGNYQQETLFAFLATVAGVLEVRVSDLTPSILRVYREPGAEA
jgi:hypothetical protein